MRRNKNKDQGLHERAIYKRALERVGNILDSVGFEYGHALQQAQEQGVEFVRDDSIPRAFKKVYSALREQTRITNRMALERPLLNSWYSTLAGGQGHGMYKGTVGLKWWNVKDIAAKAVRDAIKELERLI